MESFLTTLPPYVHTFLNKHPPTDTFHLLRELICFAVLYSNDRQRIATMSQELMDKEEKSIRPNINDDKEDSLHHDTEDTITEDSVTTEEKDVIPDRKANMPYTFPDWWGHQEFEPPARPPKENTSKLYFIYI
ncbi:hypothetical protein J3Q64DRAFT_1647487 [Phycomyces blakesleeanus]|uniref:Uncharacterized protein n=1 Tax=Phycomyces blakesleeanus TaxID=4837 RepID=A0ABR3AKF4_PHYBL